MNDTPSLIMRNLRGLSFVPVITLLTVSSAFAADGPQSASSGSGSSQQSGETSVEKELQKLFQQSGTPMPSMRNRDLPYANSPQMNRVRKIDQQPQEPSKVRQRSQGQQRSQVQLRSQAQQPSQAQQRPQAPQSETEQSPKKKSLLSRIFGRFRRDKPEADEEPAPPKPPLIVGNDGRPIRSLNVVRPSARRDMALSTDPQSRASRQQNPTQTRRPTGQVPAMQVSRPQQQQQIVRPAERRAERSPQATPSQQPSQQPQQPSPKDSEVPRLDFTVADDDDDDFVIPFEETASAGDDDVRLDLDAIEPAPQTIAEEAPVADEAPAAEFDDAAELIESADDEEHAPANPFTGLSLDEDDEWANPFEAAENADDQDLTLPPASDAPDEIDRESNPFFQAEQELQNGETEAAEAPTTRRTLKTTQIAPRVRRQPPAAEITEPETTDDQSSKNNWRARPASDRSSSSGRSATAAARSRRLATTDRTPASRTEARRWRQSGQSGTATPGKKPEFSDSIEESSGDPGDLSPQQLRRRQIESRRHLSGFMGFCPVALRETRDLVDASESFEADFGLQTFHFSSERAREQFEANPSRYAPAAGGTDVVALVNSGEQHPGSLRFAMWYRDRLYLFQSRETMGLFRENPASYADEY